MVFHQPIWKILSQNGFIFPNFRGENSKKTFELPTTQETSWIWLHQQIQPTVRPHNPSQPNHLGREQESTHFSSQFASPYRQSQIGSVERKAQGFRSLGFRRNPSGTLSSIWIWVKDDEYWWRISRCSSTYICWSKFPCHMWNHVKYSWLSAEKSLHR